MGCFTGVAPALVPFVHCSLTVSLWVSSHSHPALTSLVLPSLPSLSLLYLHSHSHSSYPDGHQIISTSATNTWTWTSLFLTSTRVRISWTYRSWWVVLYWCFMLQRLGRGSGFLLTGYVLRYNRLWRGGTVQQWATRCHLWLSAGLDEGTVEWNMVTTYLVLGMTMEQWKVSGHHSSLAGWIGEAVEHTWSPLTSG